MANTVITHHTKCDFKTDTFLRKLLDIDVHSILVRYGEAGVRVLESATPRLTGVTAASWSYGIETLPGGGYTLSWSNSNANNGVNIAMILQYGHGTRNGGYVQGVDYINPALKPVFDAIANDAWKEVEKL